MSEKKKYEVTKKHCLDYEVGEEVELTAKQSKSLVNKIKLVEEKKAENKKVK